MKQMMRTDFPDFSEIACTANPARYTKSTCDLWTQNHVPPCIAVIGDQDAIISWLFIGAYMWN